MNRDYGLLLNQDAKLHRKWFSEMASLEGVKVKYRVPIGKHTTLQGEYNQAGFSEPIEVNVIFQEHLDQATSKKLG